MSDQPPPETTPLPPDPVASEAAPGVTVTKLLASEVPSCGRAYVPRDSGPERVCGPGWNRCPDCLTVSLEASYRRIWPEAPPLGTLALPPVDPAALTVDDVLGLLDGYVRDYGCDLGIYPNVAEVAPGGDGFTLEGRSTGQRLATGTLAEVLTAAKSRGLLG